MHLFQCLGLRCPGFNILCLKGFAFDTAFAFYVNGLDVTGSYIDCEAMGKSLILLSKSYLQRWTLIVKQPKLFLLVDLS